MMEITSNQKNMLDEQRPDCVNEIWYGKDGARMIRNLKNESLLTRLQIIFTILGILVFIWTIIRMIKN